MCCFARTGKVKPRAISPTVSSPRGPHCRSKAKIRQATSATKADKTRAKQSAARHRPKKAPKSDTDTDSGSDSDSDSDYMSPDYDALDSDDNDGRGGDETEEDEEIGNAEKLSPFGDKVDPGDDEDISPTDMVEFMVSGDIQNLGLVQHDDGSLVTPMSGMAEGASNLEEEPEALGVGKRKRKLVDKAKQYCIWYD
jgi:hypothetical protein